MSQIDTTRTWLPGDTVDAAKMNEIIDQATAEDALIGGQTSLEEPVDPAADYVLLINSSAVAPKLRKALVQALHATGGVDTVDFDATPATVFNDTVTPPAHNGTVAISLSLANQNGNKILASPANGDPAAPEFRAIVPRDIVIAPQEISASLIDWSLGLVFYKTLTVATYNFTFSNPRPGQRIMVLLKKSADTTNTVTWTSPIRWPGGLNYALSTAANAHDLIEFWFIDGQYYADPFRVDMKT